MWDRRARYVSNHDGDTVTVVLDQGFNDTKTIDVRLFGVYAPELSEKGGTECRKFVTDWFVNEMSSVSTTNWNVIVTTMRMKKADSEQMTFDRYVAVITSLDGSRNLNAAVEQFIIENSYPGGVGS